MPKITFNEYDLTTQQLEQIGDNIVFIPGFSTVEASVGNYEVFTDLDKFYAFQGKQPYNRPLEDGSFLDKSWIMQQELIIRGIPVTYYQLSKNDLEEYIEAGHDVKEEVDEYILTELQKIFESRTTTTESGTVIELNPLYSLGDSTFKFLTTGGFPIFITKLEGTGKQLQLDSKQETIITQMRDIVCIRKDCTLLIDPVDDPAQELIQPETVETIKDIPVIKQVRTIFKNTDTYSDAEGGNQSRMAMFYPWYNFNITRVEVDGHYLNTQSLPGSFSYLAQLQAQTRNNNDNLAIQGVTRGKVRGMLGPNLNNILTNQIADSFMDDKGISINPITFIRDNGYCIWGNRTLKNNAEAGGITATSLLNVRECVSTIQKVTYRACKELMFEQNNSILWVNFLAKVTPTLDQLVSKGLFRKYTVLHVTDNKQYKVHQKIILYPIYDVEEFEIDLELRNDDLEINE